jgi:predicted phosphodiesterase
MSTPKIGFLSDAHGNPFALRSCIQALRERGCASLHFLGDAVGYLPMAEEVLAILANDGISCQMGNHEGMLVGRLPLQSEKDAVYGLASLRLRLGAHCIGEIAAWPTRRVLSVAGRSILLVHGSPRDELTEYTFPDSDLTPFANTGHDVIAVGHSHLPFIRTIGGTLVVGVGSCGLPRDVGNLASCALYDPASGQAEIVRVGFDPKTVLAAARAVGPVHESVVRVMQRRSEDTECDVDE